MGVTNPFTPVIRLPNPSFLADVFGYHRDMRYVAFWWDRHADDLVYSDGRIKVCGGSAEAWLSYHNNPKIQGFISHYNFGTFTDEAEFALVVDRDTSKVYISPIEPCEVFLQSHNPVSFASKNKNNEDLIESIPSRSEALQSRKDEDALFYRLEEWLQSL